MKNGKPLPEIPGPPISHFNYRSRDEKEETGRLGDGGPNAAQGGGALRTRTALAQGAVRHVALHV